MGTKRETKLIILTVLFLLTTILVHGGSKPAAVHGKPSLRDYFHNLAGYKAIRDIALTAVATKKMLKLDDYAFIDYEGEKGGVNLYIGYYYTANKLSASHSPLICYPTQGWKIDNMPEKRTLAVGRHTLNYEAIVVTSYSGQKELVLYWNQTYARTSNQAYQHKINLTYNKLMKIGEQHAFVRVAVPFANSTQEEAEKAGADFIRVFFPRFIEYFSETEPAQR